MQKKLIILAVLTAGTAAAETEVTVEVTGAGDAAAQVFLSVFDSKKTWLKRPLQQVQKPIAGDSVSFTLNLDAGEYAFHAFLDLDMNDKMKTSFIGIPKEPTAVSNEAKGKFGPPKYKDAKVEIGAEATTIPMKLVAIGDN